MKIKKIATNPLVAVFLYFILFMSGSIGVLRLGWWYIATNQIIEKLMILNRDEAIETKEKILLNDDVRSLLRRRDFQGPFIVNGLFAIFGFLLASRWRGSCYWKEAWATKENHQKEAPPFKVET